MLRRGDVFKEGQCETGGRAMPRFIVSALASAASVVGLPVVVSAAPSKSTIRTIIASVFPWKQRVASAEGGFEQHLREMARLAATWTFGLHDTPHFVNNDGRGWLVLDKNGCWEAY